MTHRRGFLHEQMKTLLNHLCEGRSLAIVRGTPDFNGPGSLETTASMVSAKNEIKRFGVC